METHFPFLALLFVTIVLPLLLIAGTRSIAKHDRKVRGRNLEASDKKAKEILESICWESKQRWINNEMMEFVYPLVGHIPGYIKLWARVRVHKTGSPHVILQYEDVQVMHIDWAKLIAECLKKRGATVSIEAALGQPTAEEIYVPITLQPEDEDNLFKSM